MFTFKLSFLDTYIDIIKNSSASFHTAEICLPKSLSKIGILEISLNSEEAASNFKLNVLNPAAKRKSMFAQPQPTSKKVIVKKSSNSLPINAPTSDNLLVNRPNSESLLSITQNLTTGEKIYQCSFCDYKGNRKDSAKRHIELKHLPKNTVLKCQLCEFTANLKHNLKKHYTSRHDLPEPAANAMLN